MSAQVTQHAAPLLPSTQCSHYHILKSSKNTYIISIKNKGIVTMNYSFKNTIY